MQNPGYSFESNVKSTIAAILVLYLFFPASAVKGDWVSDANVRIEQIRKRNVQITVVDSNGGPVSNLHVQINQIYHRFAFGACLAYWPLVSNSNYRNFFLDHFEWAVCENEMKWGSNESTRNVENYSQADYIADWCADNDIILRGHCILWEQNNSQMPSWVPGLDCDTYPNPSEMLDEIDERINSIVGRYAGQIASWDVDNEMLSDNTFGCLGEAGRAHFFELANQIDPNCGMYMNEYSGNSFGGYNGDTYASRANGLIALGAPVEGLGIQAHLNSPFQPERYYNNVLEELAVLGLPIIATEFDTDAYTESQRADDLENFYRICFSHANVEGIIMWGFWENSAWRWDGIVNSDWTLNAAGIRYEALLDEWTTNDANHSDSSGDVYFRGFHGTYEITLSVPGEPAEIYTIELEPGAGTVQFELETDLETPEPDLNAPEPNPMTWASVPMATGQSSITMTATTATDDTLPVWYYFECTTDGDANSTWQTNTTYVAQGLDPNTEYAFRVKARDSAVAQNETGYSGTVSATTSAGTGQTPYPGPDPHPIPGRIEAENYDSDGAGIAYYDTTSGNEGGAYRSDNVDIETCGEGGYNVGWIATGEWLEYSVDVAATGTYDIEARVASQSSGGNFHIEFGGSDVTGTVSFSATGGWQDYTSVFVNDVSLTAGMQIMRVSMESDYWNLTWVEFTSTSDITPPAAPTGLEATPDNGAVWLDWNDNNEVDLDGYNVYRSTTSGSEYNQINVSVVIDSNYFDNDVNNDEHYYYVVTAIDSNDNESGYSNEASAIPAYQDCADVQAGGDGLPSDLDGDCYVDYLDLETVVYYWLHTNCAGLADCEGADFEPTDGVVDFFDFSDFARDWMRCNDPEDTTCTHNW